MNPDPLVLNISQPMIQAALVAVLLWLFVRKPNRSKTHPDRQRLPKLTVVAGWGYVGLGLFLGVVSLTVDNVEDPSILAIFSLVCFVLGVLILIAYLNWYLAPRDDHITFRSVFGRERTILYRDIVEHRFRYQGKQRRLTIRSTHGTKFAVNLHYFEMTPLLAAIEFKEHHGYWRTG